MRTLTTAQNNIIGNRTRAVHLRVFVDSDGAGTFQNLASLEGKDYVIGASWGEHVDRPSGTATITLRRENYDLSLSPLRGDSRFNATDVLVEISREVRIETATTPIDQLPREDDFEIVFEGEIDKISFGGSNAMMTLSCRDRSARIQDRFLESRRIYSSQTIEFRIQNVLDDWVNDAPSLPFSLLTPVSPGFSLPAQLLNVEPVFTVIRRLAAQIGFELRFVFNDASNKFRLTLFEPDRTKTAEDFTFSSDDYRDVRQLDVSRETVRNAVQVTFNDSNAKDSPAIITRTDPTSITKYGRRFMQIARSASTGIDTGTEAVALGDAALNDLKEPTADQIVTLDYFWPVELQDLYKFEANGVHYNLDQKFAIIGFQHNVTATAATTTLTARGKPSRGVASWLGTEARPGNAPSARVSDFANGGTGTVVATRDVNPAGANNETPDGQLDQLIRNADFNIFSMGTNNFPDGWGSAFDWGSSDPLFFTDTDSKTGTRAVTFTVTTVFGAPLSSSLVPVTGDDLLIFSALVKSTDSASSRFTVTVEFFDEDRAVIVGGFDAILFDNIPTTYRKIRSSGSVAPSGARFVRLTVLFTKIGPLSNFTGTLDQVGLSRSTPFLARSGTVGGGLIPNIPTGLDISFPTSEPGDAGFTPNGGNTEFTVEVPGTYAITLVAESTDISPTGASHLLRTFLAIDQGSGFVTEAFEQDLAATDGTGSEITGTTITSNSFELDIGDKIKATVTGVTTFGDADISGAFKLTSKMLQRAEA